MIGLVAGAFPEQALCQRSVRIPASSPERRPASAGRRTHRHSGDWHLLSGTAGSVLGLSAAGALLDVHVSAVVDALVEALLIQSEDDSSTGGFACDPGSCRIRALAAGLAQGGSGAALALAASSNFAGALRLIEDARCRSAAAGSTAANPRTVELSV